MFKKVVLFSLFTLIVLFSAPTFALAVEARTLLQQATIFFSPSNQTVLEGSVFEVSVFLNTKKGSVNAVDLNLRYPADKLEIVRPSAGKSLIEVWLEPPFYSNTEGRARFSGIVPNGIITSSGLITTITFRAKKTGDAKISVASVSKILANDGMGTEVQAEFGNGVFTITPRPAEGMRVTSETHPFSSEWYNNNNPILNFEKEGGVTDFSYVLDDRPNTIPDNTSEGENVSTSFQNLNDGIWYFHIKGQRQGVWGATTHFLLRVDATSPAQFKPQTDAVIAIGGGVNRTLVSFFTTDALSGVDHYEVAVIDKANKEAISPIFIWSESPYQLPDTVSGESKVIVRAIDKAGNVRDVSVDVSRTPKQWIEKNYALVLAIVLALLIVLLLVHYLTGHRVLKHIGRIFRMVAAENRLEKEKEKEIEEMMNK
ncbi:MAG: cohesin domain-containing protein [bacterium]|nr:cohesin domain-containing protein [bacterium]